LAFLRAVFFYKQEIRHSIPQQDKNGGCAIVQGV